VYSSAVCQLLYSVVMRSVPLTVLIPSSCGRSSGP
jgi:hypothetical protein